MYSSSKAAAAAGRGQLSQSALSYLQGLEQSTKKLRATGNEKPKHPPSLSSRRGSLSSMISQLRSGKSLDSEDEEDVFNDSFGKLSSIVDDSSDSSGREKVLLELNLEPIKASPVRALPGLAQVGRSSISELRELRNSIDQSLQQPIEQKLKKDSARGSARDSKTALRRSVFKKQESDELSEVEEEVETDREPSSKKTAPKKSPFKNVVESGSSDAESIEFEVTPEPKEHLRGRKVSFKTPTPTESSSSVSSGSESSRSSDSSSSEASNTPSSSKASSRSSSSASSASTLKEREEKEETSDYDEDFEQDESEKPSRRESPEVSKAAEPRTIQGTPPRALEPQKRPETQTKIEDQATSVAKEARIPTLPPPDESIDHPDYGRKDIDQKLQLTEPQRGRTLPPVEKDAEPKEHLQVDGLHYGREPPQPLNSPKSLEETKLSPAVSHLVPSQNAVEALEQRFQEMMRQFLSSKQELPLLASRGEAPKEFGTQTDASYTVPPLRLTENALKQERITLLQEALLVSDGVQGTLRTVMETHVRLVEEMNQLEWKTLKRWQEELGRLREAHEGPSIARLNRLIEERMKKTI